MIGTRGKQNYGDAVKSERKSDPKVDGQMVKRNIRNKLKKVGKFTV